MDIKQHLVIEQTTKKMYERLAPYHYVRRDIGFYKTIWGVFPRFGHKTQYPHPVAVTVYSPPLPNLKSRNRALNGIMPTFPTASDRLHWLNKNVLYASRLIVDPRFRGKGIALWLAQETLCAQPYRIIETLTPIDQANELCERIGFISYHNPTPAFYSRLINALRQAHIGLELYKHPRLFHRRVDLLPVPQRELVLHELQRFVDHFKNHNCQPHCLERTVYIIDKLWYPHTYHVFFNEKAEISSRKTQ